MLGCHRDAGPTEEALSSPHDRWRDSGGMYDEVRNCPVLWWRDGGCTPFVSSGLTSGFRAEQEFFYKPCEQCFLPALSPWGKAWSSSKVSVGTSFYHQQRETCILGGIGWGGVTHLTYITYLLWAETKTAPKMHIPSCCPHWELRWVVICQRNPFVLRTGYGKEKKGVFSQNSCSDEFPGKQAFV